ncbi:protein delta homolog 2 [Esox lucius]|uniref:Protein delta homolog 2 n=1 Tax=Esox lucius TaxID=8010 RepID=A0AAY5KGH8_ESOLU|nr:protein delta homolog 2 [Esox lucius]XP_019902651.3 protein delta homolog 2 [Esox lucius]XP_019902652.3 protein delta homolog 2 [Esox lucius]
MPMRYSLPLLLCSCCVLLLAHQGKGQALNCTCNMTNSRCDENSVCRCDPGWEGQECDVCVRMPGCIHGSCHQPWQCNCQPGWAGRFCDKDIHVCTNEAPCQNGATCYTNVSGEYTCLCPESFHGRNCEHKTGPCHRSSRSPCKNGGQCEDSGGHALELSCRCLAGFTGPRCETNMDDCLMRPCANGATCLDGINRFSCLCPGGFVGRFCTVNLDDCASQPCLNGGRCLDRASTFQCLCKPGFTGRTCDVPLQSPENHATIRSSQGWAGGGGDRVGVTQARPDQISPGADHTQGSGERSNGDRLLKISVKEVVTQRGSSGLSEVQLIVVLALGGMTLAVVALTAGLVIRGHRRGGCGSCRWGPAPRPPPRGNRDSQPPTQSRLVVGEQECKISYLHTPTTPELEKKKLNTEVI